MIIIIIIVFIQVIFHSIPSLIVNNLVVIKIWKRRIPLSGKAVFVIIDKVILKIILEILQEFFRKFYNKLILKLYWTCLRIRVLLEHFYVSN